MTDAVKMAIEVLDKCRAQFQFYANEHTAAGNLEKAATNQRFADMAACALEQAGEPVSGIGHGEEADYAELKRLYNFSDDDSAQFTRWNMLTAIRHGKRLGQEFDAGEGISEAEALALRGPSDDDRAVAENIYKAQRDRGAFCTSEVAALIASYRTMVTLGSAHPPQSRGQAFDGELPLKFDPRDAKRWWEGNMKESKFVSARLAGDGYVKFQWRDADESGDYSVPWTRIALWLAALSSAKRGEER